MEEPVYPPHPPYSYHLRKPTLPNSVAALVFGIISLATMAWFGWIMAIVALNNARKALQMADEQPGKYNDTTIRMAQAGRTMGTWGLILGLLGIFVWVLYFAFIIYFATMAGDVFEPEGINYY
jgi:hypothetical protein